MLNAIAALFNIQRGVGAASQLKIFPNGWIENVFAQRDGYSNNKEVL